MFPQHGRPHVREHLGVAPRIAQQVHHELRRLQPIVNPLAVERIDQRGRIANRRPVAPCHARDRPAHRQQRARYLLRLAADLPLAAHLVGVRDQQLLRIHPRRPGGGSQRAASQIRRLAAEREHPPVPRLSHPVIVAQFQVTVDPRLITPRGRDVTPRGHPMNHAPQPLHTHFSCDAATHALRQQHESRLECCFPTGSNAAAQPRNVVWVGARGGVDNLDPAHETRPGGHGVAQQLRVQRPASNGAAARRKRVGLGPRGVRRAAEPVQFEAADGGGVVEDMTGPHGLQSTDGAGSEPVATRLIAGRDEHVRHVHDQRVVARPSGVIRSGRTGGTGAHNDHVGRVVRPVLAGLIAGRRGGGGLCCIHHRHSYTQWGRRRVVG